MCRKSYIHSAILELAAEGQLPSVMRTLAAAKAHRTGLTKNEITLVKFLRYAEKWHDDKISSTGQGNKAEKKAA